MRNVSDKHMRKSVDFLKEYSMDFLDYREKLGIGYCDKDKFSFFLTKMFNVLKEISEYTYSGCVTSDEYFSFCNLTGSRYDNRISADYHNRERFNECLTILDRHHNRLEEFLTYYIAFTNSIAPQKTLPQNWTREHFANLLVQMLAESHIPIELIKSGDEYFAFPKGAKELDDALVSEPLEWLADYPISHNAFVKALREYSETTSDNASDVADKFRKTLESFFQEFFGGNKSLENYKNTYGTYLKGRGVPKEISGNFETLLQAYTNFMNNYAKHRDATSNRLLEYLMYQTGNIIRLLITLKQGEDKQ